MEVAMWVAIVVAMLLAAEKVGRYFENRYPDPVKRCGVYRNEGCNAVDGPLCDYDKCKDRIEYELMELENQLDMPDTLRYHRLLRKRLMNVGGKELLDKLIEDVNMLNNNNANLAYRLNYNPFEVRKMIKVRDLTEQDFISITIVLMINETELLPIVKHCRKSEQKAGEDRVCMLAIRTFFWAGLMAKYTNPDIFKQINELYEKKKPVQ